MGTLIVTVSEAFRQCFGDTQWFAILQPKVSPDNKKMMEKYPLIQQLGIVRVQGQVPALIRNKNPDHVWKKP